MAVKDNQSNLEQAILDTFRLEKPDSEDIMEDYGHGRLETRTCKAYSTLSHVENPDLWAGLFTFFIVESNVFDVFEKATGKESSEQRLYISSLQMPRR